VLVAYRLGQGLVIRTGIPSWPARLARDIPTQEETRRIYSILRG
jgi:hypothetical protein